MSIDWVPVFEDDDTFIGYDFVCPICGEINYFGAYYDDYVKCELCGAELQNEVKPMD